MNKYFVEFLGTLFLIFIILITDNYLIIGASLSIAIFLGGPISKGCFSPVVTFALYASGELAYYELFPYIVVQIIGAVVAVELVKMIKNK